MHIILTDWAQYNLTRKSHNPHNRSQGLLSVLNGLKRTAVKTPYKLSLIINDSHFTGEYDYLKEGYPFITNILYKHNNLGLDFGAYDYGYQQLKKDDYSGHVLFLNSVVDIVTPFWLDQLIDLFESDNTVGLCSVTYNGLAFKKNDPNTGFHNQPFLHGYCLLTSMAHLRQVCPDHLPGHNEVSKKEAIINGEAQLSRLFLNKGFRLKAQLNQLSYAKDEPWVWGRDHFDLKSFINTRYKI